MKFENEEKCPICNTDYVHMIRTWILGEDHNCFVLDGRSCSDDPIFVKLFPYMVNYRGSRVIILFESEHCEHLWFKSTYFHKGQTYTDINILSNSELKKIGMKDKPSISMWRD